MKTLNITKGKWRKGLNNDKSVVSDCLDGTIPSICICPILLNEAEDNASLIVDAGNAYNTTPILPSELLKQRNELLLALKSLRFAILNCNDTQILAYSQEAKELINNIENATNA